MKDLKYFSKKTSCQLQTRSYKYILKLDILDVNLGQT